MALLATIVRVLLFLFLVRFLGIVLRAFFGGFSQGVRPPSSGGRDVGPDAARGQVEELVKDPICGVHTARSTAIAGRFDGAPAYFCSEECARKAQER